MSRSLIAKSVSGLLSLKPKETLNKRNKKIKKIINRGEKSSVPSRILKTRYVDNKNGRIFYANESSNSNIVIIYIHGGAYCTDFLPFHWLFLRKIIKNTNAKIIAPAYRLVPFGTYKEAFDLIIPIYNECIKSNNKVILMGDSAGGGLALSLAIYFKKNNYRMPNELILLSPWVDVILDNDEIKKYEEKDPMLKVDSLKASIEMWKGNLDYHDWHVSPLYGDLDDISCVTTFVGTREIFYPDIIKLYEKLNPNLDNKLIVGQEMNHVYPLMPIPESKEAINKLIEFITRNNTFK